MAANQQQGRYLCTFLSAFTGFVAGLVLWAAHHTATGVIVAFVSVVFLVYALVGFPRIKHLEFTE